MLTPGMTGVIRAVDEKCDGSCTRRAPGCHTGCPIYEAQVAKNEKRKKARDAAMEQSTARTTIYRKFADQKFDGYIQRARKKKWNTRQSSKEQIRKAGNHG